MKYRRTHCRSVLVLETWLWTAASLSRFAWRCNSCFSIWYFSFSVCISCWTKSIASSIIGSFKEFVHSLSATHLSSEAKMKNLLFSALPLPLSNMKNTGNVYYMTLVWSVFALFKQPQYIWLFLLLFKMIFKDKWFHYTLLFCSQRKKPIHWTCSSLKKKTLCLLDKYIRF